MGCRGGCEGVDVLEPGPVEADVWDGCPRLRPVLTDCDTTFTSEGSVSVPAKL